MIYWSIHNFILEICYTKYNSFYMYIAMNRFQISLGNEDIFENIWKNRETYLDDVKGFLGFNLMKGDKFDNYTLYISHSTWESHLDFITWTKSRAFREAHKDAGANKKIYKGSPQFEGFNVVL